MSAFERVKAVTEKELRVPSEKITMEARLKEDLKFDSLDMVSLISALEDEFEKELGGKEIDDKEVRNIGTIGEIVTYLEKQQG